MCPVELALCRAYKKKGLGGPLHRGMPRNEWNESFHGMSGMDLSRIGGSGGTSRFVVFFVICLRNFRNLPP
jgi:hypothetical protein